MKLIQPQPELREFFLNFINKFLKFWKKDALYLYKFINFGNFLHYFVNFDNLMQ